MTRSIWKGPYIRNSTLTILQSLIGKKKIFEIKCRNSVILPVFVGLFLKVHNGRSYNRFYIKKSMVGHKLGEFSPTRKYIIKKSKTNGKKS